MSPTAPDPAALKGRLNAALAEIRPRIRGHAGDVVVTDASEGNVTVEFLGACRGCPAQAFTFLAVVEPALRAVEGVNYIDPPRSAGSPAVRQRIQRVIDAGRN